MLKNIAKECEKKTSLKNEKCAEMEIRSAHFENISQQLKKTRNQLEDSITELQASKKSLLSKLDKAEEGGGSSKERKSEGRSVGAASVVVGETDGGVEKSKGKKKKGAK